MNRIKENEVADAVRFCLNNLFVNGSVLEVNGGLLSVRELFI